MWNSCTSVVPNTCAWEQQEWNKTKTEEEGEKRRVIWREVKKLSQRHNCSSGLPSSRSRYLPEQWMNYQTNLTYTYNPSTTPWGHTTKEEETSTTRLTHCHLLSQNTIRTRNKNTEFNVQYCNCVSPWFYFILDLSSTALIPRRYTFIAER